MPAEDKRELERIEKISSFAALLSWRKLANAKKIVCLSLTES
jgi:hypothetical protein